MFWKNKRVQDWSLLSTLTDVEFVGFFHNQWIDGLWDMAGNTRLAGLFISDFTRLHSLDGIRRAPRLERLYFGDAVWPTSILDDIQALKECRLKAFHFAGKAIKDDDVTPYTTMNHLEILDFPPNLYATDQLAWLVARLPHVEGYALGPFVQYESPKGDKDVRICGKGKPLLSSTKDASKVAKYVDSFQRMVERSRAT